MKEEVILVDLEDKPTGIGEKLSVHLEGKLHRAISVFLFNSKGELLLQRRALGKYHSGGLWTNTCCSHPRPGEKTLDAAKRRLFEEMGIQCELKKAFDFVYLAELDHGLIEYEFDHVFVGAFDGEPQLNPDEALGFRWRNLQQIGKDIETNPSHFTVWFKEILSSKRLDPWLSIGI